jgi:glyoxylate/hydroxypyruvate reductase A
VRVLLQFPGRGVAAWREALATALPEATIEAWPEVRTAPAGRAVARPDYALVWKPPPELFTVAPPTRAVFNLGAGVDALVAVPTLPRDVPVIRLEDAGMAAPMAEYVALAVLAAHRESRAYAAAQRESRWAPQPRRAPKDFGVGLLGLGVLGQAVAAVLSPFGFPLHGWSRASRAVPGVTCHAGAAELPALLARSRVLVCLLPSTAETRGLLDRATLSMLPVGAEVVNAGRGDLIVDADLLALLDGGHLGGATLDVFRDEPLPPMHPFWHHPRVTITPHVSAVTDVEASVAQVTAKIRRLERGEPVSGVVDVARGY